HTPPANRIGYEAIRNASTRGMRERAARAGATLSVTSAPGAGSSIVVTVPGRVIFRKTSTGLAASVREVTVRRSCDAAFR
ncbi:MAG TPA: hypothetical protein VF219_01035, partial [Vicinamibacterales bacterium]